MECVAFHFLTNHVRRLIMAIFQYDTVKIHQAQIVKEWLGGSMKNHFHTFFLAVDHHIVQPAMTFFKASWKRCVL